MRLLNVTSLEFAEFFTDREMPAYVVASHRWQGESEVTFQDVQRKTAVEGPGMNKVKSFAKYVKEKISSVEWLWIDTCCINKENSQELSEAINSMFDWYRNAYICLAYLADVDDADDHINFGRSEWFRRGWTLQELLAPRVVVFLTSTWQVLGHKGSSYEPGPVCSLGRALEQQITEITNVPVPVLRNYATSSTIPVHEKLKWMEGRVTTREEDMWYAMFGIFDVPLGANYGEKAHRAEKRLLLALKNQEKEEEQKAERLAKVTEWLAPPNPWTNHDSARQRHEPGTGAWFLRSDQYLAWKSGSVKHLWLFGKAGCGKTVLFSSAVEDIRVLCDNVAGAGMAVFYFSFSDSSKQTYESLVRTLVSQLGRKEPGLSLLYNASLSLDARTPGITELEKILLGCIASYAEVFLHIDALDECSRNDEERWEVLERIARLLQARQNVRMLVTSRDNPEIRRHMEIVGADTMAVATRAVDSDIERYVANQLSRDWKLSQLDQTTTDLIKSTLTEKANGMFRWAYCQLQELKKSKSTKPKSIKAALLALPATIDETYERILNNIDENDRSDALALLRWIAYAESPRSLRELSEAIIVETPDDPEIPGVVDTENRGGWSDTIAILDGLISLGPDENELEYSRPLPETPETSGERTDGPQALQIRSKLNANTKVKLAHFSVQEYLESTRILTGSAKHFHLTPIEGHRFIAQSCLVYLQHWSESGLEYLKRHAPGWSLKRQLALSHAFPLLGYASSSWYRHSALQGDVQKPIREFNFLNSDRGRGAWALALVWSSEYFTPAFDNGSGLYSASAAGLKEVAAMFLDQGADVNARGGRFGSALRAACFYSYPGIVELLLEAGADVHALDASSRSPLYDHCEQGGDPKITSLLLRYGSDANTRNDNGCSVIIMASASGHADNVKLLIQHGADVNARGGGLDSTPLYSASMHGHTSVVKLLLEQGADVNASGHYFYGRPLQAATAAGRLSCVKLLLEYGADVNSMEGARGCALRIAAQHWHRRTAIDLMELLREYGATDDALHAACAEGDIGSIRRLLENGADPNVWIDGDFSPLQLACSSGNEHAVLELLKHGADVHAGLNGSALHAACAQPNESILELLFAYGADVNERGEEDYSALQIACFEGHPSNVSLLLDRGADVHAGFNGHALHAAAAGGNVAIVRMLLEAGADIDSQGSDYGSVLQIAFDAEHTDVSHLLMEYKAQEAAYFEFGLQSLQAPLVLLPA